MLHPITRAGLGLSLALLGLSCGSNKVLVPPRLDLRPYGKVAIVLFTVENARGSLHQLATERFAEAVLAAQPGIELLELGSQDTLVRRVGEQELGIAAAQELGGSGASPRCSPAISRSRTPRPRAGSVAS